MLAASRGLISCVAPMGPPVFVFFLLLSFSFVPNLPSEQLAHLFPSFLAGCHSIMPACHKQAHHYQQLMPFSSSSSSSSCLSSQNHSSTHTHTHTWFSFLIFLIIFHFLLYVGFFFSTFLFGVQEWFNSWGFWRVFVFLFFFDGKTLFSPVYQFNLIIFDVNTYARRHMAQCSSTSVLSCWAITVPGFVVHLFFLSLSTLRAIPSSRLIDVGVCVCVCYMHKQQLFVHLTHCWMRPRKNCVKRRNKSFVSFF